MEKTKLWLDEVLATESISLRAIASVLDIPYESFRRISTKPIPGKIYNPGELNVDEMAKYIADRECELVEVSEIPQKQIAKTVQLSDFEIGSKVTFKRNYQGVFTLLATHGKFLILTSEDLTQRPVVINGDTFVHQGPVKEAK